MKKMKVGEILAGDGVTIAVYEEFGKNNPFRVVKEWMEADKYPYPTKHSKTMVCYGNLASAAYWMFEYVNRHDKEE